MLKPVWYTPKNGKQPDTLPGGTIIILYLDRVHFEKPNSPSK